MRPVAPLAALLLALLAQPALALLHEAPTMEEEVPAVGAEATFDPLLKQERMFLTADGGIVHEAPAEGAVPAPMATPGSEAAAIWAHDAMMPAAFEGDVLLTVPIRASLPAATVPQRALFTVALLVRGEEAASADVGPTTLLPGETELAAPLAAGGLAFEAGDSIGVRIAFHSLSPGPAPAVEYLVGPEGGRLDFAVRLASLDALGHQHAAGDRHVPYRADAVRLGDLGDGVWGLDLSIGTGGPPARLEVPASASRARLHLYLTPDLPDPPAVVRLDLPGGPTEVHRGELVVRDVPVAQAGTITCTGCGASPGPIATVARAAPTEAQGETLQPTQARGGAAARAADGEVWWLAVLFAPAGLMLVGCLAYVMRTGGSWHPPASAARPAPRAAPRREPQGGGDGARFGPRAAVVRRR